jgi:hypothetical protein
MWLSAVCIWQHPLPGGEGLAGAWGTVSAWLFAVPDMQRVPLLCVQ